MAIQNRRGIYSDFDPTKMVEGEFAVVQSGDPNTSDGKAVYIAPTTGTAERVALYKDLQQEVQAAITDATDEVIQEVTAGIIEGVAEDVTKAETAATNAETSAQNAEQSAQEAQEVLENKADKDGYYPDLYAGNLSSTRKQTDSVPYLMRKTGGDLSRVGEREGDTLVGATVRANQLLDKDAFRTTGGTSAISDDVITVTPTGSSNRYQHLTDVVKDHVYYQVVTLKSDGTHIVSFTNYQYLSVNASTTSATWTEISTIGKASGSGTAYIQTYSQSSTEYQIKHGSFMLIDLTACFGSTIADYLYNLESATAGAGVAKLREWGFFTGEYIPYNTGSLESVEARSHVMRGFNQFDETKLTELPNIEKVSDGWRATSSAWRVASLNWETIDYIDGQSYCCSVDLTNTGVTGFRFEWHYTDGTVTLPTIAVPTDGRSTCVVVSDPSKTIEELIINYGGNSGAVLTIHSFCINLSSDRNGEYEPYSAHTYDLGTDTLRGLFKLDSNNNLYADGDRKTSDGTIIRKYGVVDLGTLTWNVINTNVFYADVSGKAVNNANIICSNYTNAGVYENYNNFADKTIASSASVYRIAIKDSAYTDAAAFKTAMSGVMLVYELAAPTTEQSTPFTNPQICDPDGTEEYTTNNGVPVGHETEYDYDIKGLAEELIDVPDVPSTNGTYVLKATRSASGISYEWVSST